MVLLQYDKISYTSLAKRGRLIIEYWPIGEVIEEMADAEWNVKKVNNILLIARRMSGILLMIA